MKILILKNHLKEGLDSLSKIGGENSLMALPILKNFLMETVDNKIKLSMTNLEIAITTLIPAKVIEKGELTIPFGVFNSIVNNIQSERIDLEVQNNNLIIKTDNYEAKIQGIKKEEFPIIPKIGENNFLLEISNLFFKKALISVMSASQFSQNRPELSGISFNYQVGQIKLAATDSFRLTEKTINSNQFKCEAEKEFKTIIPLKTAQEAVRVFKDEDKQISVYFDSNQVLFKTENMEMISRLINGDFPDYQSIIPESLEIEAVVNKEEFINALKLVGSFSDKLNEIKIIIKEKAKNIEIYSFNQVVGENKYLIPAKIKGNPIEIVFNWRFLMDGIKNLDSEDIFIGFNSDNKPAIIKNSKDSSYFYILMPIKAS
jgi:DNA polymerase-3 subunit beta